MKKRAGAKDPRFFNLITAAAIFIEEQAEENENKE
jgi:hypothetical protein